MGALRSGSGGRFLVMEWEKVVVLGGEGRGVVSLLRFLLDASLSSPPPPPCLYLLPVPQEPQE